MKFVYYEDQYCYYIRKPAGIPSTFWKEKSFLELVFEEVDNEIIKKLKYNFSEEEEYGLLNRLDNATSGLLYFAKSKEIKEKYKDLQKKGCVNKYYILECYWDITYWTKENWNIINYPIVHHKFSKDRMVVVKKNKDLEKWKTRLHHVETKILEHCRDKDRQVSVVVVSIQKWIRHQIRSHFSSIGYPIVGDEIYWKKKDQEKWYLQLFSVGLLVNG